ncbi:TraX protein [compost metagenome]
MLGVAGLLAGWLFSEQLMYGLPGVMLPGAWLMARRKGGAAWVLPCLLAMGGNLTNSWLREHLLAPITVLTLIAAALAIPVGLLLLRHDDWRVPAVGRWGYLFYPVHLLVIKVFA